MKCSIRSIVAVGIMAASPLAALGGGTHVVCQQLVPGVESPMAFVDADGNSRAASAEEVSSLLEQERARAAFQTETLVMKSGITRLSIKSTAKKGGEAPYVVATAPIGTGGAKGLANFVILSVDGGGEGVNDPTARAAVGGNPGTTIGQQRANAMQQAALYWGGKLNSTVDINVEVDWEPLTCNSGGGVLGSAGALAASDFGGAPAASTLYHDPLANSFAGTDLFGSDPEIFASFNSSVDNNNSCLTGTNWYYGYDGNFGGDIDFFDTFKHEMAHGLGFSTYVNTATGVKSGGLDDVFMQFLYDPTVSPSDWPSMSNAQRMGSATNNGNLLWDMATVTAEAASRLSSGIGAGGRVRMYAPASLAPGSSVSHWDEVLFPHELMEPIADPTPDDTLTQLAFEGMGWTGDLGPSAVGEWQEY